MRLISGSGRSPGEENDNQLQYSCLGNPLGRRAWWATVHGVTKVWHGLAIKNMMPPELKLKHNDTEVPQLPLLSLGTLWQVLWCYVSCMLLYSWWEHWIFNKDEPMLSSMSHINRTWVFLIALTTKFLDETGAHYIEWSKPERYTPLQYTNTYIWNLERC